MIRRNKVNLMAAESCAPQSRAGVFIIPQEPRVHDAECLGDASQEERHRNGPRVCGMEGLSGLRGGERKPGYQSSQRLHADKREQRRTVTRPPASRFDDFEQTWNEPAISRAEHEIWTNNFAAVAEDHLFGDGAAGTGRRGRVIVSFDFDEAAVGSGAVNTAGTEVDNSANTGLPALFNDIACAEFVGLVGKTRVGADI